MNKFFWVIVVLVCAFLSSFLLVLTLGGMIYSGEQAIGVGMLWYYSLPALIILGVLTGWFSFSWYLKQQRLWLMCCGLLMLSFTLAVSAPVITYLVFWVRALVRGIN
jgi:hypothetical protein